MKYAIAREATAGILEVTVNEFMGRGWEPHGSLVVSTETPQYPEYPPAIWYMQPMVLA
jgi:hypothetical protein